MKMIKIQPAMLPDKTLPYPLYIVDDNGNIGRQDVWNGKPLRLIGFSETREVGSVDLELHDFIEDPLQAKGMYMVTEYTDGTYVTYQQKVISVHEMNV